MGAQAGIYNALAVPNKSAFDYANEFEDQAYKRQANALSIKLNSQKADEYTRGLQEKEALRSYLGGAPDLSSTQGQAGLYRAAPGLAGDVLKTNAEVRAKDATTQKTSMEVLQSRVDLRIRMLQNATSPMQLIEYGKRAVAAGHMTPQELEQGLSDMPQTPAEFAKWRGGELAQGMEYGKRVEMLGKQANDVMVPDPNNPGKFIVNEPLVAAKSRVAKAGASSVSVNTGQKGYENESKLRNDFKSEPIYKDFHDMKSAHAQIKAGIAQGTPIADTAVATKIMKLLDPGSVVRESELAIAMAAAGKLDRLQNYLQMQVSGNKLTPQQRQDFGALADELMGAASQAYNLKRAEYEKFGQGYGLNPAVLGAPAPPSNATSSKPAAGGLSQAEAAELEQLRKRFNKAK